jgi:hypothetical protein
MTGTEIVVKRKGGKIRIVLAGSEVVMTRERPKNHYDAERRNEIFIYFYPFDMQPTP